MEPTLKEQRKPVRRAFFLGVLTTLLAIAVWNSIPESNERWVIQIIAFAVHAFIWVLMIALVAKFCTTVWKWFDR